MGTGGVTKYVLVIDAAQGASKGADSFAACVAHEERRDEGRVAVQDFLFEATPPFSPRSVLAEIAAIARRYHVTRIHGDAHAAGFVAELLSGHGLTFVPLERDRSALYLDALSMLNSGQASLLDHAKQRRQILGLRRSLHSGGRVSVDHQRGQHDDVANVGLAALVVAFGVEGKRLKKKVVFSFGPSEAEWNARAETAPQRTTDAKWSALPTPCLPRESEIGGTRPFERDGGNPLGLRASGGGSPFDRGNDTRGPFNRR